MAEPRPARTLRPRRSLVLLVLLVGATAAHALPPTPTEFAAWFAAHAAPLAAAGEVGSVAATFVHSAPAANDDVLLSAAAGDCHAVDGTPAGPAGGSTGTPGQRPVYRIGSVTKLVTATAAFQLSERGLLDLDAPIATYLPALAARLTARGDEYSTRDLMRHAVPLDERTLGVQGYKHGRAPDGGGDDGATLPGLVDALWTDWTAPPGTRRVSYANMGVGMEGAVVEAVAGMSLAEYVATYIAAPLNLTTVRFHRARDSDAVCYGPTSAGYEPFEIYPISSGDLYASTADVARFLAAHAQGGRGLFARPETAAEMHAVLHPGTAVLPGLFHGMAHQFFANVVVGTRVLYHTGGVYSFTCMAGFYPDHGDGLFIATTPGRASTGAFVEEGLFASFAAAFYNALGQPDEVVNTLPIAAAADAHRLDALVGTYVSARRVHYGITAIANLAFSTEVALHEEEEEEGGTVLVVREGDRTTVFDQTVRNASTTVTTPANKVVLMARGGAMPQRFLVATLAADVPPTPTAAGLGSVLYIEDVTGGSTLEPVTFASDLTPNMILLLFEGLVLLTSLGVAAASAVRCVGRACARRGSALETAASTSTAAVAVAATTPLLRSSSSPGEYGGANVQADDWKVDNDDDGGDERAGAAGWARRLRAATAVLDTVLALAATLIAVALALVATTPVPNVLMDTPAPYIIVAVSFLVHVVGTYVLNATIVGLAAVGLGHADVADLVHRRVPWTRARIGTAAAMLVFQTLGLVGLVNLNFVSFRFW